MIPGFQSVKLKCAMAYRIKNSARLLEAGSRIYKEQVRHLYRDIENAPNDPDEALHEVRKRLKKIRALLKLYRYLRPVAREENRFFRDLGRRLSDLRDAKAKLELLYALERESGKDPGASGLRPVREKLEVLHREQTADGRRILKALEETWRAIRKFEQEQAPWESPAEDDMALLTSGLKRYYKRNQKAHRACFSKGKPNPEADFHDYRKQAKTLYLQLQILENGWPKIMKAYRIEWQRQATLLGDDHDITIMQDLLAERNFRESLEPRNLFEFTAGMDSHRRDLRIRARTLGNLLLIDSPKIAARRIQTYWSHRRKAPNKALA